MSAPEGWVVIALQLQEREEVEEEEEEEQEEEQEEVVVVETPPLAICAVQNYCLVNYPLPTVDDAKGLHVQRVKKAREI